MLCFLYNTLNIKTIFIIADLKITCFGDSNVRKYQDLLHSGILSKCKFVLTYNFDNLKENLCEIDGADFVIIHVLTNDTKYICYDQYWKSDYERKNDLICLAHNFVNMIKKLIAKYPNMKIIISMILPRFDKKDLLKNSKGNDIINVEISKYLLEVENVILIKNEDMKATDFFDKFHLLKSSFQNMCMKWKIAIGE